VARVVEELLTLRDVLAGVARKEKKNNFEGHPWNNPCVSFKVFFFSFG